MFEIFDAEWVSNHFLYAAYFGLGFIFLLVILIVRRLNKDIQEMNRRSRRKMTDFLKKTSKHNKPERKKLKFE